MTIAISGCGINILFYIYCSEPFCFDIICFEDEERLMLGGCSGDLLGICVLALCEVMDLSGWSYEHSL